MNRMLGITMKIFRSGRFSALVALVGLGLLFTASGVKAGGCAPIPYKAGAAPSIPFVSPKADGKSLDHQEGDEWDRFAIVGLWHVNYTAESESGAPIFPPVPFPFAETFKMWHADGIEFENAVKPPTGNNICYGVWRDLGDGSVKLHHIGLMFDSAGNLSLAELAMSLQLAAQEQQNKKTPRFIVSDLGTLGGTFGEALGINNEGLISGAATLPGDNDQHLFLWIRGHKIDLGTLGGPNSGAFYGGNVNDLGQVVGNSEISTPDPLGQDHCFYGTHLTCLPILWRDGLMILLPRLRGGNNGSAQGINNRGQVSGVSQNGTPDATCPQEGNVAPEGRPVIWENGVVHELSSFPGDPDANGIAINDRGQVVGWSGKCTTLVHAVLWQNGTVTDLGNLGGAPQEGFSISATDINNQGQVVGYSPAGTSTHAFLWENGLMTDIGTLSGDFSSFAWGINSEGWVVGTSVDASGNSRAFIRDGDVIMDLNTLIPADSTLLLLDALGINAHGEIVGDAMEKSTGEIHAYFLNPCYGTCNWLPGTIAMGSDTNNSLTSRRLLEHHLARIHPYSVFGLSVPQK